MTEWIEADQFREHNISDCTTPVCGIALGSIVVVVSLDKDSVYLALHVSNLVVVLALVCLGEPQLCVCGANVKRSGRFRLPH